jgi:hypothetical protein
MDGRPQVGPGLSDPIALGLDSFSQLLKPGGGDRQPFRIDPKVPLHPVLPDRPDGSRR